MAYNSMSKSSQNKSMTDFRK